MADIFTVTAPLKVRLPDGRQQVVTELFRHPEGLLYFDLFWHQCAVNDRDKVIHLLKGELKGTGPWKIDGHIFYVLGCRGTDMELATEHSEWQTWRMHHAGDYPDDRMIMRIASGYGCMQA